jgi:hypothetical protein
MVAASKAVLVRGLLAGLRLLFIDGTSCAKSKLRDWDKQDYAPESAQSPQQTGVTEPSQYYSELQVKSMESKNFTNSAN